MSEDQGNPPETEKYLALARQGKEVWNKWRQENPEEIANFAGVDFTRKKNRKINFGGFVFEDWADFSKAKFDAGHNSWDKKKREALAKGASPEGGAYFVGASFGWNANLSGASFGNRANLSGASFGDEANLSGASFGDEANLSGARFGYEANLSGASFGDWANLSGASFGYEANLSGASFEDYADFSSVHFKYVIFSSIDKVTKENDEDKKEKQPCIFKSVDFSRARFDDLAKFTGCSFTGQANFSYAEFATVPEFAGSEGHGYLDVTGMKIGFTGEPPWVQPYWTTNTNIATRIRRLRKIMADIHAQDVERDLFILERQAERLPLLLDKPFQGIGAILLLGFYWLLSNYGRSIRRPIFWFCAQLGGFFWLYQKLIPPNGKENFLHDVMSYTSSHALPFVGSLNPTRDKMMARLFGKEEMLVPLNVELLSILQSGLGALLLFLILQALRNHFKIK